VNVGSLSSGLLTGLREGVEAALIVSIVLAYLAKTGNARHFGKVWLGTGLAIVVSLALGLVLFSTVRGFPEPWEMVFEGGAMLLAAAVVTWMLFWMRRQAASAKGDLHRAVDRVLSEGSIWGLALLAFTAVIREGVETSLFLVGQATSAEGDAVWVLIGAVIGLTIAVVLGYGFFRGSRRLNLASFFRWTGVALIFIAAGLLSHAAHEFVEVAEYYGVAVVGAERAFDLSGILPHEAIEGAPGGLVLVLGQFLRALFGYTSRPEVVTLLVHVTYVVVVLAAYLRPPAGRASQGSDTRIATAAR
jgi:high-affinity iron transporter